MDDRIKQLLRDLGTAINESISSSGDVNLRLQKLRDEGYDLYVVLDATIGLNRQDGDDGEPHERSEQVALTPVIRGENEVQFRINVDDLSLLRSMGIDPTRKTRSMKRVEAIGQASDDQQ